MTKEKSNEDTQTIQAVERAFNIIELLRESGPATVSEVSETLDLTTSTAHIYLKTLRNVGYVVQTESRYRLGLRFLRDGIAVQESIPLYWEAKDEVDKLAEETGEGVGVGVEENGQRVALYHARGGKSVHDHASIGEFTHMHWTALGKALLAHKDPSDIADILDQYGMPRATDSTITNTEELFDELEQIREQGYALENEERREGLRSVALPIRVEDETVGAISITGPTHRMTDDHIESELIDTLHESIDVIKVNYLYE
jgi:DNA-binding IclR family transcriptional regulator